jgi:hypothetical protein
MTQRDERLCKGTHPNSTYADQVRHFRLLAEALEEVLHAFRRFLGRITDSINRPLCGIAHDIRSAFRDTTYDICRLLRRIRRSG